MRYVLVSRNSLCYVHVIELVRATRTMWTSENARTIKAMRCPKSLSSSMAEFAKALPQLRYIDVGLQVLVTSPRLLIWELSARGVGRQ